MKTYRIVMSVALLASIAACGGSGSGTTPATPTSTETKVAADAAVSTAGQASLGAMGNGFQNAFIPQAMIVSKAATPYTGTVNQTQNCSGGNGSYTSTGTFGISCIGSEVSSWSCGDMTLTTTITFTDCAVAVTEGSTTYNEVLNGTVQPTGVTGSASGTGETISSVTLTGGLTGTLTITGDVAGTVVLDGTSFSVSGASVENLTPTCSGTCSVTIGSTTQTCTVASTCDGCTL